MILSSLSETPPHVVSTVSAQTIIYKLGAREAQHGKGHNRTLTVLHTIKTDRAIGESFQSLSRINEPTCVIAWEYSNAIRQSRVLDGWKGTIAV